jgi:phosphoribosylformylglycinamidine (FGAM) synthase PurS component
MIRCIDIALIIPDNEARTALATLQRLGVGVAMLERADLYRFDVEDEEANDLVTRVRATETIFNPNKHIMRVRALSKPDVGEVWVGDLASPIAAGDVRVGRRVLPGVRAFERFTAWRMYGAPGVRANAELVAAATETLLCNPAFQKASVA